MHRHRDAGCLAEDEVSQCGFGVSQAPVFTQYHNNLLPSCVSLFSSLAASAPIWYFTGLTPCNVRFNYSILMTTTLCLRFFMCLTQTTNLSACVILVVIMRLDNILRVNNLKFHLN